MTSKAQNAKKTVRPNFRLFILTPLESHIFLFFLDCNLRMEPSVQAISKKASESHECTKSIFLILFLFFASCQEKKNLKAGRY